MDWLRLPSRRGSDGTADSEIAEAGQLPAIPESTSGPDSILPGQALTSDDAVPPLPPRSIFRRMMGSPPRVSADTLPPEYETYDSRYEKRDRPPEGAVLGDGHRRIASRGGWKRLITLLVLLLCIAIALGVGLGVGLGHRKKAATTSESSPEGASPSAAAAEFPIGEYSLDIALRSIQTNCTSNPSTWRCYPYTTYSASDPASANTSITIFNWIITNTSSTYVTNTSFPTTNSNGIPSNLSISSSDNPFSISFTAQPLVYYNDNNQPRYTFNHTMSQQTSPSSALTDDNSASTCFYNSTILSAVLYLSAAETSGAPAVDFPAPSSQEGGVAGNFASWPFAVRVQQIAAGGVDVPACYKTMNGVVGERITAGFSAEAEEDICRCDYRNYEP
ncbi:hypothetical protein AAFC00_000712 [Neodothiora populina]|uniref:Tat pathway signal sequence n=1 Tax=Neodothiora populina TaxID=2781224 RepID=A0ABR3PE75_9PEZI